MILSIADAKARFLVVVLEQQAIRLYGLVG
jgi:hypothetical protein